MLKFLSMKLLTITLLSITTFNYAQVGINTTTPTTDLDVNGNLRVRNLSKGTVISDEIGNFSVSPFKIIAMGKIDENGNPYKISGASIKREAKGYYTVNFDSTLNDKNYIIVLTNRNCYGNCSLNSSNDLSIGYLDQNPNGFSVVAINNQINTNSKEYTDTEFMFIVYSF